MKKIRKTKKYIIKNVINKKYRQNLKMKKKKNIKFKA